MSSTILVLEDDSALRELLSDVLEDEGYHVVAAESLPRLLDIAPRNASLLITDLLFDQEVAGVRAIPCIRAATSSHLPVLICTAAQKQVALLEAEINRLGAKVLAKPFTIEELLQAVRNALGQIKCGSSSLASCTVFA